MAIIQKKTTTNLDSVNRDPSKINSELLRFSNSLINDLKLKGYDYRIFEGYRTNERQNYLYSVKKTTSLKGGQSKHNKIPSEAISIVQYIKGQPVWGGAISGQEFKTIVNDKLLSYPNIIWGGNWKNPNPYQFEISIPVRPKEINPPQIQPTNKPVSIVPNPPTIQIVNPVEQPKLIPLVKTETTPLKPVSVKMEVDNSTIIVFGLMAVAYLYFKK